jgi:predicted transcriptional regulator
MNVPRILRYCRHQAGLSQRDLATSIGVPQPAIARIESGRVVPRVDTLMLMINACGFTLEARRVSGLDRSAIRELLRLSPRERLDLAAEEANNLQRLVRS